MNSVLLISTGQPSTNPRLVKEAIALAGDGYKVTVLYSFWADWAFKTDKKIISENSIINWIEVGGNPYQKKLLYIISRFIQKFFVIIAPFLKKNVTIQIASIFKNYFFILKKAKSLKADLYIAHNLGALPVAYKAAEYYKSKFGFDFEDYHLGQVSNNNLYAYQTNLIETRFLKGASYTTAASPLIASAYKSRFPQLNPVTINNVFSKNFVNKNFNIYTEGDKLKLFWFSQTVGFNRGLEELIEAIGLIQKKDIHLGILGSCSLDIKNVILDIAKKFGVKENQITFHTPVGLEELFDIASTYHVGLALEVEKTVNRQICLTNKLFVYLCSSLAIIATDTEAQKAFLEKNTQIGVYYNSGDAYALSSVILKYKEQPSLLNKHRKEATLLAETRLNWEYESLLFFKLINQVLSS